MNQTHKTIVLYTEYILLAKHTHSDVGKWDREPDMGYICEDKKGIFTNKEKGNFNFWCGDNKITLKNQHICLNTWKYINGNSTLIKIKDNFRYVRETFRHPLAYYDDDFRFCR